MKIVIVGGTGLIGSLLAVELRARGLEVLPVSPSTGVNAMTGEGVGRALRGSDVVVDVTNSPTFDDAGVLEFFTRTTVNLLTAERDAGVKHHVLLSIVGAERLSQSGYFRAKTEQEALVRESGIPFSVIHATQFFEFITSIAEAATVGRVARLPHALMQPISAIDVAFAVGRTAAGEPINGMFEIAGPLQYGMDDLVQTTLESMGDDRAVVTDPDARYFNQHLEIGDLLPSDDAEIFSMTLDDWLKGDS
jgi:uncharacterized protein YbjT (DUF2867 family)